MQLLLLLGSLAACAAQPSELRLGIFISWEGGWDVGDFVAPAVLHAIDDINSNPSLLPSTQLKWVWHDGQCMANFATEAMMDMKLVYDVDAFVGPPCSVSVLRVAPMGNYWRLPFISWAAASPLLSDKSLYPNFGRVNGNYLKLNPMFLAFAENVGWDHLAVVYADNGLFGPTADDLVATIQAHPDMQLSFTKLFSDTTKSNAGQSMLWMPLMKESGARVVVILGYCADIRDVLLAAKRLDMLEGYQYLMLDATSGCHIVSGDGWPETWGPEANAEAAEAFDYTFNVASLAYSSPETTAFEEQIVEDFEDRVFEPYRFPPAGDIVVDPPLPQNKYNLSYEIRTDQGYQSYALSYAALLYDAIAIYARAADAVIRNGDDPSANPEKVTEMLPSINFTGFSGFVDLDENLDRTPDVALMQIKRESDAVLRLDQVGQFLAETQEYSDAGEAIQFYPGGTEVLPTAWVPRECTLDDFTYMQQDCDSHGKVEVVFTKVPDVVCTGDTPSASSDCAYVPEESSTGQAIISLGTVGIVVALALMIWVAVHSKEKIVRYAQPVFCQLFLLGCLCLNMSSILLVGKNNEKTCVASPWIFHMSFTLCLSALVSKIYRVWRIFDNKKLRRRRISIADMSKVIGLFLAVDLILLTIMAIVDPLTPEEQTEIADDGSEVEITQDECGSGGDLLFMLWAVKISLMIGASALSCQTRSVDEKFAESKHIMIAVYQVTILSIVALLVATMADSTELRVLVQVFTATVASIGSMLAIFLPKVLVLHGCAEADFMFGANSIDNSSMAARSSMGKRSSGKKESSVATSSEENGDKGASSAREGAYAIVPIPQGDSSDTVLSGERRDSSDKSARKTSDSSLTGSNAGSTALATEVVGYYSFTRTALPGSDAQVVGGGQVGVSTDWQEPC